MLVYKFRKSQDKVYRFEDYQFSEDVDSIDAAYNKSDNDDKNQR